MAGCPSPTRPPCTPERAAGALAWGVRVGLVAVAAERLLAGQPLGALVAAGGLALTFAPRAIDRCSVRVPGCVELVYVAMVGLVSASQAVGASQWFSAAATIVHLVELFLLTLLVLWLLRGAFEAERHRSPAVTAVVAVLVGIGVGVFWEFGEFTADLLGVSQAQQGNADTMTDLLANASGSILGGLAAGWLYREVLSPCDRRRLAGLARWGESHLAACLARHGARLGLAVALLLIGIIVFAWWTGRHPAAV